jgi:DNA-binding SARP family transcriptional activator
VLGPIEVLVGRTFVPVSGRNPRAVLTALVLGIDHAVPVDQLIVAVWGDDAPASARSTLQGYISGLRHDVGPIDFEDDAYVLRLSPGVIDSVVFEQLAIDAHAVIESNPDRARMVAMQALELWRGRPFGDLADDEFVELEVLRLEEMRLDVMELRLEADILTGRSSHAAGILAGIVQDHPYRERLWYLFMTALAHQGRRVEALRAFREVSDLLADVGLEPSRDLAELEQSILVEAPPLRAHLGGRYSAASS